MFASALVGRWLSKGPSERSLPLAGYLCSCKQTTDKSDREKARKRIGAREPVAQSGELASAFRRRSVGATYASCHSNARPAAAAESSRGGGSSQREPSHRWPDRPIGLRSRARDKCHTAAEQREREPRRSTGRSRRLASERPMPMSARSCACLRVCACERFPSLCEQQVH